MTYRRLPADLPDRLKKAGLKVVEIDGWRARGRPSSTGEFKPVGVLNHHTGTHDPIGDFADDLTYAKWLFLTGRKDLPPPLCQLSISAEGTVYVGASGRANHAGKAKASGSVAAGDGNALYAGIEWMLSGTQAIPAGMYAAAVKTNAVLLDIFGSSEQASSCHYQTSVTGKWDIGDPDGVPFSGHKVLDVPKFRGAIKEYRNSQKPKPPPKPTPTPPAKDATVIDVMHVSMQFSDSGPQKKSDADKIFARAKSRNVAWLTGTEGTFGAVPAATLLKEAAEKNGYRFARQGSDAWVAIQGSLVKGNWKATYVKVIDGVAGKYPDRGVFYVEFDAARGLGHVTVIAAHYNTDGAPGGPQAENNRKIAKVIGDVATAQGANAALVFYGGDQNIGDKAHDTFFKQPLTSTWDELKKWPNTGHGNIDVIASYNGDKRVSAAYSRVLDDSKFPLNTDHFLVEAGFKVSVL